MSIIDKALRKVAESAASSTAATAASAAPGGKVALPRRSIQVDMDALYAAGVISADEKEAGRRSDEFRRIKWPLLAAAFGNPFEQVPQGDLILVTSSTPDEGKTFVSINMALSFAREGSSGVLLVDGDLEKQHVSRLLGAGDKPGVVELLQNPSLAPDEVVLQTDIPRLAILPSGSRTAVGPELLSSRGIERLFTWFSQAYPGYVMLFDSPPLLARTEAQVLARHVGQVLFVIRADFSLRSTVQDALAMIPQGPLVRCVLNQAQRMMLAGYYGDYYDYADKDQKAK